MHATARMQGNEGIWSTVEGLTRFQLGNLGQLL